MVGDDECTPWSEWTECSKTCGHGTHSRTRKCSNPGPNIERKDCPRNEKQDKSCADNTCGKYNSLEKYFVKFIHYKAYYRYFGTLSKYSELDCSLKSCYGAKPNHVCCDTCNDVRQAYYDKGWFFGTSNFAQCAGKYFWII